MAFLIKQQGEPVSKEKILNHIWPELGDNPSSTVVKRNISSLRSKLRVEFKDPIITDNGYQVNLPVEVVIFKNVEFDRLSCY